MIASWSGFVYQGKIALYHCIQLLISGNSQADHLKNESLDDFVIYGSGGNALSRHQVKARADTKRSAYVPALIQAADVIAYCIDSNTKRWFHVACELDDFFPYATVTKEQSQGINRASVIDLS